MVSPTRMAGARTTAGGDAVRRKPAGPGRVLSAAKPTLINLYPNAMNSGPRDRTGARRCALGGGPRRATFEHVRIS